MSGASRQGCQTGVGGSVVTHNPTDLVCPLNELSDVAADTGFGVLVQNLIRSLSALVV